MRRKGFARKVGPAEPLELGLYPNLEPPAKEAWLKDVRKVSYYKGIRAPSIINISSLVPNSHR